MTDDQTKSSDDAESAATLSDGLPEIDREWSLPGEELAQPHDEQVEPFVVDDPEAEELTTPESDPVEGAVDDEAQLDAATRAARAARSSRAVRRVAPAAQAEEADEELDADEVEGDAEAVVVAASPLRPKRRRASDETSDAADSDTAAGKKVVARKGRATPRRENLTETHHRVGPIEFTQQSAAELRKVIWPTGEQLVQYFTVVLVFVLFIITFVGLLDLFFGWGLLKLLGN